VFTTLYRISNRANVDPIQSIGLATVVFDVKYKHKKGRSTSTHLDRPGFVMVSLVEVHPSTVDKNNSRDCYI